MPWLSRILLKSSLLYLLAGFTIGALILANKGLAFHPPLWRLLPIHIELLLLGWTLQVILGVAYWILPRFWQKPRRGSTTGAYLAFTLLNLGIGLVVAYYIWSLGSAVLILGRALELAAVISFGISVRPRVVARNVQI